MSTSTFPHFQSHLNKIFNTEFGQSESKTIPVTENPSYSDEEYRLLKAFITGQLTKYVNNLKLDGTSIPFMYDQSQSIIGVATFIFYIFMTPYIIDILSEQFIASPNTFEVMLLDKHFRNVWLYGGSTQHVMNVSRGTIGSVAGVGFDPSVFATNPALKEAVESIFTLVNMPEHIDVSEAPNGKASIVDFEQILSNRLAAVHSAMSAQILALGPTWTAMITYARQNFYTMMNRVKETCELRPGAVINKNGILSVMELMRTIFTFYFKGGNSIREISQRVNNLVSDDFKIDNIDESIPYGSDFDTNFLINPYLPKLTTDKIKTVIQVFIPQISQYIRLHPSFRKPLSEVNNELFIGKRGEKKDEQQLQMNIIINSYKTIMEYLSPDKQSKLKRLHRPNFDGPIMKISPQVKKDGTIVRSQLTYCQKTTTDTCSTTTHSKHSEIFPSPSQLNCEIPVNNDYCFGCLQYSINLTIPRFDLHRYFLKFNFNSDFQKSNAKHRLINVADGSYNCELLDISIVNPVYVLDSQDKISCELIELWNNSDDIFKMEVYDKYNLASVLETTPIFRSGVLVSDADVFKSFPVFVNGLKMQIDDLSLAVKDSVLQGKMDKVGKRIQRLRLLNYVKIISGIYPVEVVKDIVINSKLVDFDVPLFQNDNEFVTKLNTYITGLGGLGREFTTADIKYLNAIYDYISAHEHSTIFTSGINSLPIQIYASSTSGGTMIELFYLLGTFVLKYSLEANPDYLFAIQTFNTLLLDFFKNVFAFAFYPDESPQIIAGGVVEHEFILSPTSKFQIKTQQFLIKYSNFNTLLASLIKNVHTEKEKKIHDFKIPSLVLALLASPTNHIITDQSRFTSDLSEDTKRIIKSLFGEVINTTTGDIDIEQPDVLNISAFVPPSGGQVHVSYEAEEVKKSIFESDVIISLSHFCSSLSEMFNDSEVVSTIISSKYRFLLNNEPLQNLNNIVTFGVSKNMMSSVNSVLLKYLELIGSEYIQQADLSREFDPSSSSFLSAFVGVPGTRIVLEYVINFPGGQMTIGNSLFYNHFISTYLSLLGFPARVYTSSNRYMTDNNHFLLYPNGNVSLLYSFKEGNEELAKNVKFGGNVTIKVINSFTEDPTRYTVSMTPEETIPKTENVLVYGGYEKMIISRLQGTLVVKPPELRPLQHDLISYLISSPTSEWDKFLSGQTWPYRGETGPYYFGSIGGGRVKRKKQSRKINKRKFKKHTVKKRGRK
jgi:hypothetical protein